MDKKNKNKFLYPWREHNNFLLHIDSEQYFSRLLDLIEQARCYVVIEQYLVESGFLTSQLIDALVDAARRNVAVMLLFDNFGSAKLNNTDRQRLKHKNIQLEFFNPIRYRRWHSNFKRNHRKLVIIDNQFGMTGGAGFTDEFDTRNNPEGWHDVLLEVSGPVIDDWKNSFSAIWQQYAKLPQQFHNCISTPNTTGTMKGRLVLTYPPVHHGISRSVINHIQRSTQRTWLATPYFVITRKLRRALIRAAKRGVDVRLLLPSNNSDHPWVTHAFHNYYDKLLERGIRIFEYRTRFIHAKVVFCDQWVSIGSSNLDRWNKRWSLDANQEIDDARFASITERFFIDDFAQSHEITMTEWRQRSWLKRLQEKVCHYLVVLLEMIGRSYQR